MPAKKKPQITSITVGGATLAMPQYNNIKLPIVTVDVVDDDVPAAITEAYRAVVGIALNELAAFKTGHATGKGAIGILKEYAKMAGL